MTDRTVATVSPLADVVVVVAATLAVSTVILLGIVDGLTRLLVSVPLLFFLPGYALLGALFPGRRTLDDGDPGSRGLATFLGSNALGWGERVALSFATSLALLPPLGVLLSLLRAPLSVGPIVGALASFTVLSAGLGVLRRLQLPPEQRFAVPVGALVAELRDGTVRAPTWFDAALNLAVLVVVVAALAGLAYGVASPPRDEDYTEAALLTREGDSLVAGNFTTEVQVGEPMSTTVTVENREDARQQYTLVVVLERVRSSDAAASILERQELTREQFSVADGRTRAVSPTVRPSLLGEDLRLSYYLYEGDGPETASASTADQHLFLWVDVQSPAGNESANSLASPAAVGAA
jgi:uncharacterized membrane protein